MVHFTLFHLKSPKKIIFLTYMFSLWCWPEFKASRRSACSHSCHLEIPGDALGTQTFPGSTEYLFGEIKKRLQKLSENCVLSASLDRLELGVC